MKTFIIAIIAASFCLLTTAQASSVSSLKKQVADAQKEVDRAQADFDQARENAESGMSSSDKAEWRQAEAKFDNLMAKGGDPKKIAAQKNTLQELESRAMKSSDRERIDDSRDELARAFAKLNQAKSDLRVAQQKTNNDDSSQAIQPENRTQNGSGFSIRSERDAENHPPLPASQ